MMGAGNFTDEFKRDAVAQIACTFVAEGAGEPLRQRARQAGDLSGMAVVFDRQHQRQQRQEIACGRVARQRHAEGLPATGKADPHQPPFCTSAAMSMPFIAPTISLSIGT